MPTTELKVANFFTEINHKFCKHNTKQFPNIKSLHRLEEVMSGGRWVKARGLKDRNPFTQQVVQEGYLCLATLLTLNELCISAARFVLHVVKKISSNIYNLVNKYTGTLPSVTSSESSHESAQSTHTHTR